MCMCDRSLEREQLLFTWVVLFRRTCCWLMMIGGAPCSPLIITRLKSLLRSVVEKKVFTLGRVFVFYWLCCMVMSSQVPLSQVSVVLTLFQREEVNKAKSSLGENCVPFLTCIYEGTWTLCCTRRRCVYNSLQYNSVEMLAVLSFWYIASSCNVITPESMTPSSETLRKNWGREASDWAVDPNSNWVG